MENFLSVINKVASAKSELELTVSESMVKYKQIESDISDCYHILELLPLNGGQMLQVTSKLVKLLKQRRNLKPVMHYAQEINNPLASKTLEKKYASANSILKAHNEAVLKYTNEAKQSYQRLFNEAS